jgi:hypothetical protein
MKLNINKFIYYTYAFGNIHLCKILEIKNSNEIKIQIKNGNKRNININKLFNSKDEVIQYLKNSNKGTNLIQKFELEEIFK